MLNLVVKKLIKNFGRTLSRSDDCNRFRLFYLLFMKSIRTRMYEVIIQPFFQFYWHHRLTTSTNNKMFTIVVLCLMIPFYRHLVAFILFYIADIYYLFPKMTVR